MTNETKAVGRNIGLSAGLERRLPYETAFQLFRAHLRGEKFSLHYHGRILDVDGMDLGNRCVWVVAAGTGLPVHIRADGSSKDGPMIWLSSNAGAKT